MTPGDVKACIASFSRSGRFLRSTNARSISSSSPVLSALPLALCLDHSPCQTSGRGIRHILNELDGPAPLYQEGFGFAEPSFAPFVHQWEHSNSELRKQEDKGLKNHDDLDQQAHSLARRSPQIDFQLVPLQYTSDTFISSR